MGDMYSFSMKIAQICGVNASVIFCNIYYWVKKNKANKKHYYEGRYWTYNSIPAFEELFPFLTKKQIRTAIEKLKQEGLIECGRFNKMGYDRTTWYTVTEKGEKAING